MDNELTLFDRIEVIKTTNQKYFIDWNNYKRFSKKQTDKDQLSLFDL